MNKPKRIVIETTNKEIKIVCPCGDFRSWGVGADRIKEQIVVFQRQHAKCVKDTKR